MRVLIDACVWGGAVPEVRAAGHDVASVGDLPADPGDRALLQRAGAEDRVLVTLDKDFGELAVTRGVPHRGILRLVRFPARLQGVACVRALATHGDLLASGAIVTAEPGRLRVRLPEGQERPGAS